MGRADPSHDETGESGIRKESLEGNQSVEGAFGMERRQGQGAKAVMVFVVMWYDYDNTNVWAVFSTKEKAEAWLSTKSKRERGNSEILEWVVDKEEVGK